MRKIDPFQRHKQFVLASMGGTFMAGRGFVAPTARANDDDGPVAREAAQMKLQLFDHLRTLKAIQSRERKIETKRELLPLYDAWVAGVLAGGGGFHDDVFTTIMIWRIDVGDFAVAMPMIAHVLRHKLAMPERINRTAATFITEEIADAALEILTLGEAANRPPVAIEVLGELEDLVALEDMHDEVRAKLQKAIAKTMAASDDDGQARRQETLARYLRALELDPKAGVKKEIDQLQRALKKDAAAVETITPPQQGAG